MASKAPATAAPLPESRPSSQAGGGNIFSRFFRFCRESSSELKKVEWPGQNQVIQGTVVVIVACIIVGFYLWINDQVWKEFVSKVLL